MRWRRFFLLVARNHPAQFTKICERSVESHTIARRIHARFGERVAHFDQRTLDESDPGFQIDQSRVRIAGLRAHGCRTERPRPMP